MSKIVWTALIAFVVIAGNQLADDKAEHDSATAACAVNGGTLRGTTCINFSTQPK
jgi:hypothetical protein